MDLIINTENKEYIENCINNSKKFKLKSTDLTNLILMTQNRDYINKYICNNHNIKLEDINNFKTALNRMQIINFKDIEAEVVSQEFSKEGESITLLSEYNNLLTINLEDTESKVDFEMNTKDLLTTEKNVVTMNVTLKSRNKKYKFNV